MAQVRIERPEFSPDDWRGLAKHLRELALGMMDDKMRARMYRQASDYELTADRLEERGFAPAPRQRAGSAVLSSAVGINAPAHKQRLFRRMLAWRPRTVGRTLISRP